MTGIDDKDLMDLDLDFELPPLPKLNTPGGAEITAAAPTPSTPKLNIDDILSAPDSVTPVPPPSDKMELDFSATTPKTPSADEDLIPAAPVKKPVSTPASSGVIPPVAKKPVSTPASSIPGGIPVVKKPVSTPASELPSGGISVGKKAVTTPASEQTAQPVITESITDAIKQLENNSFNNTAPAEPSYENKVQEDIIPDADDDFDLPPMKARPVTENNIQENTVSSADDDFDLPPMKARPVVENNIQENTVPDTPETSSYEEESKSEGGLNFVMDDDYDPEGALEDMDTSHIVLSDMDKKVSYIRSGEQDAAKALKQQIMMDDMSMSIKQKPVLEDLSNEYVSMKEKVKKDDFTTKSKLDDNEKKAMKDRLSEELNRRPENFNHRRSEAMAKRLAEERSLERAKKGLVLTIVVMFISIACAVVTYIGVKAVNDLFMYLAAGTLVFSLMLMIKSKHTKVLSTIYLIANTLVLAGPGLIKYVLDQKTAPDPNFNIQLIWFIAAIVLSGAAVFMLCTNDYISAYYNVNIKRKK